MIDISSVLSQALEIPLHIWAWTLHTWFWFRRAAIIRTLWHYYSEIKKIKLERCIVSFKVYRKGWLGKLCQSVLARANRALRMELLLLSLLPTPRWRQLTLVSDKLSSFASPVSLESQSVSLELLEGQRPNYLGCFTLGPTSVISPPEAENRLCKWSIDTVSVFPRQSWKNIQITKEFCVFRVLLKHVISKGKLGSQWKTNRRK